MSRDKQNIKTTDWLIRGIPEEQLKREKREAVLSAYLELCITYDEETKSIDFDATAEKMVAEGYVRSFDVVEEIFAEIDKALDDSVETEHFKGTWFNFSKFKQRLAELKKKYTKEK
jgi:predicted kinase